MSGPVGAWCPEVSSSSGISSNDKWIMMTGIFLFTCILYIHLSISKIRGIYLFYLSNSLSSIASHCSVTETLPSWVYWCRVPCIFLLIISTTVTVLFTHWPFPTKIICFFCSSYKVYVNKAFLLGCFFFFLLLETFLIQYQHKQISCCDLS